MRNVAMLFAATLLFLSAQAQQGSLKGRLVDEKNAPLSFANISLLRTQKNAPLVSGSLTDSLGYFNIATPANGTYFLQFTTIGFAKLNSDSFEVSRPDFSKDFGTLTAKKRN